MIKIEDLAKTFDFDSMALEKNLRWVKERYEKKLKEYNSELSEYEVNELLSDATSYTA